MARRKTVAGEPKLGIAFLVKGRLFVASKPLAECEDWGEFKNYPGDHFQYWAELRRMKVVPAESKYEEHPRGRAVFNGNTGQFSLYLDRCIASKRRVVRRIISQLHLPADTLVASDPHYRCHKCLGKAEASFGVGAPHQDIDE
jgi:hypothetical protein